MDELLDQWFVQEILVHEAALVRYLRRTWPHRDEVHDMRQEVYVRVYKAAAKARPQSPKSFLFTTARNLMVDHLRRERVVSIAAVGDFEALNVPAEEISPEQSLSTRQELKRLAKAFDRLPDRCRQVIWLRRVEELSQKEVASRLGISQKTVEKQVAKGARRIAEYLFGGSDRNHGAGQAQQEDEHGKQHAD